MEPLCCNEGSLPPDITTRRTGRFLSLLAHENGRGIGRCAARLPSETPARGHAWVSALLASALRRPMFEGTGEEARRGRGEKGASHGRRRQEGEHGGRRSPQERPRDRAQRARARV